MADPHLPTSITDTAVTIHTAPLPEDHKVLVFVEANVSSGHVQLPTPAGLRGCAFELTHAQNAENC